MKAISQTAQAMSNIFKCYLDNKIVLAYGKEISFHTKVIQEQSAINFVTANVKSMKKTHNKVVQGHSNIY